MTKQQINKIIKSIGDFFDILSHPDRLRIINILKDKETDVTGIHEMLNISQSVTSQHLKLLKLNGIVEDRKEGKHVYYKLKNNNIAKVMQTALNFQIFTYSAEPETVNLINDLLKTWHI